MSRAITTLPVIPASARTTAGWVAVPWRIGLIAAVLAATAAGLWFGEPATSLQADPALGRLLRGMALLKGGMALAAAAAVWWRFSWPVSLRVALVYGAGCAVLAGSTALIWQLTSIPLAAVLFHSAAVGMAIVGWRER